MPAHLHSVYRTIADELRNDIASGKLKKGDKLAPERSLMARFNVERTTVRRALELLVTDGLIEKRIGIGAFVSDGKTKTTEPAKSIPVHKAEKAAASAIVEPVKDMNAAADMVYNKLVSLHHASIAVVTADANVYGLTLTAAIQSGAGETTNRRMADDLSELGACFRELWRTSDRSRFTAVVTANTNEAKAIIRACGDLGIAVPDRLSVVCLDSDGTVAGCRFDEDALLAVTGKTVGVKKASAPLAVLLKPTFAEGKTLTDGAAAAGAARTMPSFLL